MGDEAFEIPLFPLDVVLFPGMALPLHIFERRYREMMGCCLDSNVSFGVVLDDEQGHDEPARVGTIAHISDYERLPDGRYNLLATGTERFEVLELRHGKSYLTGLVRVLRDEVTPDVERLATLTCAARTALKTYLRTMLSLLGSNDCHFAIPHDPTELSYVIGMCLTCEDCEKQALLETRTPDARLAQGIELLREETAALAHQIESENESKTHPPGAADRYRLN